MSALPLEQAIPRFKANELRVDRFANGDDDETWTTSGGDAVPSLRKFLKDSLEKFTVATPEIWGAVGDGTTDDRDALREAMEATAGVARLRIDKTYGTTGEIYLYDRNYVEGLGKVRLLAGTAANQNVFTNIGNTRSAHTTYNELIVVKGITLDGNSARLGGDFSAVGSHVNGCALGFASVKHALVEGVTLINAAKHCFDGSASVYSPADGIATAYMDGPSEHVDVVRCIARNAGDDLFTTHHSTYIRFRGLFGDGSDSGGLVSTNTNFCEFDDGSRKCSIDGGYAKNCVRGVEVKAHVWAPAAQDISISRVTAQGCVRSFDLRHIGFRIAYLGESPSVSAKNVSITDCISIAPQKREGATATPRHLNIHSYRNVQVRNFVAIGGGDLSTPNSENEDPGYFELVAASSVNVSGDTITVASNVDRWVTGQAVRVTTNDTMPGGLTSGTTYYVIRDNATTIRLATTGTNAVAGTAINITGQGVGTHRLTQVEAAIGISIHFYAGMIQFNGVHFEGEVSAGELTRVTGSASGYIEFDNINATNCAGYVISISGSLPGIRIGRVNAFTNVDPAPSAVIRSTYRISTASFSIGEVNFSGYAAFAIIGTDSLITVTQPVITTGSRAYAVASEIGYMTAEFTFAAATTGNYTISGIRGFLIGTANGCTASGERGGIIAAFNSVNSGNFSSLILASSNVSNPNSYRTVFGYAASGSALSANQKVSIDSLTGNIAAAGTITGSATFTDYAEMFETEDGLPIDLGTLVKLDGMYIVPTVDDDDDVLGVVSATAGIVLGDTPFTWAKRYMTGQFGEQIMADIPDPDWSPLVPDPEWDVPGASAPLVPNPTPQGTISLPVQNPDWNPETPNIPRSERQEWHRVGHMGQILVRTKEPFAARQYLSAAGRVAGGRTPIYVMGVKAPFSSENGYGVAKCFVKPAVWQ